MEIKVENQNFNIIPLASNLKTNKQKNTFFFLTSVLHLTNTYIQSKALQWEAQYSLNRQRAAISVPKLNTQGLILISW